MTHTLSIHEAAEAEIDEAADFYDYESPGLGSAFLAEIETGLQSVAQFPEAAPLLHGRVRTKILHRFPYSLIYSIRQDGIRILAVAHHKRRPFYWRSRR